LRGVGIQCEHHRIVGGLDLPLIEVNDRQRPRSSHKRVVVVERLDNQSPVTSAGIVISAGIITNAVTITGVVTGTVTSIVTVTVTVTSAVTVALATGVFGGLVVIRVAPHDQSTE
ncbi:MAG: hypothetical protein OXT09_21870, partial [Myxococcales bacterium]|nr:hypothetical protein [Myxococcales bacterium]